MVSRLCQKIVSVQFEFDVYDVQHKPRFLVNQVAETLLSAVIWLPCNSATIAKQYRKF
jgi:nicotinamide phosphoribosyltransferase